MKILIGNDHGGYKLKKILIDYLKEKGFEVEDVGSHSTEIVRYPYYAAKVANAVSDNQSLRGILQ
ncbi:MAG: RpiB/LacA/LacB family sugar-phosphate isomerase [Chitinophagaceae bacterium]